MDQGYHRSSLSDSTEHGIGSRNNDRLFPPTMTSFNKNKHTATSINQETPSHLNPSKTIPSSNSIFHQGRVDDHRPSLLAVHTPPPGFAGSSSKSEVLRHRTRSGDGYPVISTLSTATAPSHYGESIRNETLSAPPPGFYEEINHHRGRGMDSHDGGGDTILTHAGSDGISHLVGPSSSELRQSHDSFGGLLGRVKSSQQTSYAINATDDISEDDKKRTTSFTNLAAALGEGLAVSMDNSTSGQQQTAGYAIVDRHNLTGSTSSHYRSSDTDFVKDLRVSSPNGASALANLSSEQQQLLQQTTDSQRSIQTSSSISGVTTNSRPRLSQEMDSYHQRGVKPSTSRVIGNDVNQVNNSNNNYYIQPNSFVHESQPKREPPSLAVINTTTSRHHAYDAYMRSHSPSSLNVIRSSSPAAPAPPPSNTPPLRQDTDDAVNRDYLLASVMQRNLVIDRSLVRANSGNLEELKNIVDSTRASSSSAPPNIIESDNRSPQSLLTAGSSHTAVHNRQRVYLRSTPSPLAHSSSPFPNQQHPHFNTNSSTHPQHSLFPPPPTNPPKSKPILPTPLELSSEDEIAPFLRDVQPPQSLSSLSSPCTKTSRGLAILYASCLLLEGSTISIKDIRSLCEAFGALESFRGDFVATRGVLFLSYYDLRSAQHAAMELGVQLCHLALTDVVAAVGAERMVVKYCTPLNSSAISDESTILLSNFSREMDEDRLSAMMASYGDVRSVQYQVHTQQTGSGDDESVSFLVEFYDIQDARQALLELETTRPWGAGVKVEVGMRNPSKRRQGREILALIGRWRHWNRGTSAGSAATSAGSGTVMPASVPVNRILPVSPFTTSVSTSIEASQASSTSSSPLPRAASPAAYSNIIYQQPHGTTYPRDHTDNTTTTISDSTPHRHLAQLVVTPDGQYSYMMINQAPTPPPQQLPHHHRPPPPHHHVLQHGPHGTYVTSVPVHDAHHYNWPTSTATTATANHHLSQSHTPPPPQPPQQHFLSAATHSVILPGGAAASPYIDLRHSGISYPISTVPMYATVQHAAVGNMGGGVEVQQQQERTSNERSSNGGGHNKRGGVNNKHDRQGDGDDVNLSLDVEAVKNGSDTRTSLMVRNIPNKYTQKMLLAEFNDCGHGSDKIDFFYLPIDFKNKCNRGYAFVNFVNYRDILNFHERYNGKHWRVFNSDKICDITYARIQGKAAMIKRFEHSALLDKDDEYRPLVFVSHGKDKGQREAFPSYGSGGSHHNNHAGGGSGRSTPNSISPSPPPAKPRPI